MGSERGFPANEREAERAWAGVGSSWSEDWSTLSLADLYDWEKRFLSKDQKAAAKDTLQRKPRQIPADGSFSRPPEMN